MHLITHCMCLQSGFPWFPRGRVRFHSSFSFMESWVTSLVNFLLEKEIAESHRARTKYKRRLNKKGKWLGSASTCYARLYWLPMGGPALFESEEWIEDADEGKEGKKRELYLVCKNEKKCVLKYGLTCWFWLMNNNINFCIIIIFFMMIQFLKLPGHNGYCLLSLHVGGRGSVSSKADWWVTASLCCIVKTLSQKRGGGLESYIIV